MKRVLFLKPFGSKRKGSEYDLSDKHADFVIKLQVAEELDAKAGRTKKPVKAAAPVLPSDAAAETETKNDVENSSDNLLNTENGPLTTHPVNKDDAKPLENSAVKTARARKPKAEAATKPEKTKRNTKKK